MKKEKTWHWYFAKDNELLLDLDSPAKVHYFRINLAHAINRGFLPFKDAYLYPSLRPKHYHAAVILSRPLPAAERIAWELFLQSDLWRGLNDLVRAGGQGLPSLVIATHEFEFRKPDYVCECKGKHSRKMDAAKCSAFQQVKEVKREFFPRNLDRVKARKKRSPVLKFGRLSLRSILRDR